MFEIKMKNLERSFQLAKKESAKFVAVRIEMNGFPEAEIIVNPIVNAEFKIGVLQEHL